MKKNLVINCASCDARNIQEENYAHYETIVINCTTVLTSPEGKAVMSKLPVTLNCTNVMEVEQNVEFRVVNGRSEIKGGDGIPENKFYLLVNGTLTIGPETQKQLAQCVGMTVNGTLTCPESIYTTLTGVNVNGSTTCYPDGAIVLKRNAVIDKLFALRAKCGLYWSGRRMIMVDAELDGEVLRNKGVSFSTKEVIVAESKVESLLELIDERAEIIMVPDGTTVVLDDLTLDETALRRYGTHLYVIGDVTIPKDTNVLDELHYLTIHGDARVPQDQRERFLDVVHEISGDVKVAKSSGVVLQDKPVLKITKWMLEQHPMGVEVCDCAVVKLVDDIPKEWIVERLHIEDCGVVKCAKELVDAVSIICKDVGEIVTPDQQDDLGGSLQAALGGIKGMMDTKVINTVEYTM